MQAYEKVHNSKSHPYFDLTWCSIHAHTKQRKVRCHFWQLEKMDVVQL